MSRFHLESDWTDKAGRFYTHVTNLERGLILRCARFADDFHIPAAGAVFPCLAGEEVLEKLDAVITVFDTESVRRMGRAEAVVRVEDAARPGTGRKRQWRGESSPGDALFAPQDWNEDALEAMREGKSCLGLAVSKKGSDSSQNVLHVLCLGVVVELHREARRRDWRGALPGHLDVPFVIVCLPADWKERHRQCATKDCRVWKFRFDSALEPPVQVSRSWTSSLWDAVGLVYRHCQL